MRVTSRLFLLLTIVLGLCLVAPNAFAEKKSELADVLGEIEWGDSKDAVLKKMKSKMLVEIRSDKKLRSDPRLLQRARKKVIDDIKAAEKSYTRLEGSRTGYEVSVIADEYSTNNGESFIRIKDKVAQRFYFFIDGRLYKLVVSYNPSYLRNIGFEAFVAQSAKKYGRPAVAEYDTIRGEETLALVQWEDPRTVLQVKNKKELFDTYTMAFSDRQTVKRLRASKRDFGGSDKDEEELSASVQALMNGSATDANADVVDGIAGRTTIDLNEGRPKDDQIRRYDEDGNVVASAEAKQDKPKKKKKKKKKKKRTKKKKAPDFSNVEANTSDDLIIY